MIYLCKFEVMGLGEVIKNRRKKLKLTREALAFKSSISEKSLYNYEENKRSPSVLQLERIAKALKMSSPEMLDDNFSVSEKLSEDDIVQKILSLQHRSDIKLSGIIRIITKVLQRLPLGTK